MGFLVASVPLWIAVSGCIACAALAALALKGHPFQRLQTEAMQHIWLATLTALALMWTVSAWLQDGPALHILGATLLVTLFGWRLALLGMFIIIAVVAVMLDASWQGVGLTMLVCGAVPTFVSALIEAAIVKWLPHKRPIFVAGHGFAAAAVASLATGVVDSLSHTALRGGPLLVFPAHYAALLGLLALGEAWFSGMITLLVAIYKPAWASNFTGQLNRIDR